MRAYSRGKRSGGINSQPMRGRARSRTTTPSTSTATSSVSSRCSPTGGLRLNAAAFYNKYEDRRKEHQVQIQERGQGHDLRS